MTTRSKVAANVSKVATMERGEEETLDAVTFVDANGNRVGQERTSMFSTMCLNKVADMLSRGFGSTVSLTLVEFKNGETARKVSPLGSRSRAVPILGENQEVKKLGDLTIELARSLGSCTHCKLDKSKCNRVKDDKCGLKTKRADAVRITIRQVKRELKFQPAPRPSYWVGTSYYWPKLRETNRE